MSRSRKQGADRPDPAAEAFAAGADLVRRNPALAAVHANFVRAKGNVDAPGQGLVRADSNGRVHIHPTRRAEPGEWAWALAHALLHLGFGHLPAAKELREQPDRFDLAARCTVVNRFLATFPIGTAPTTSPRATPTATRSSSPPAGAGPASRPPTSGAAPRTASPTSCWSSGRAGTPPCPTGSSPSRTP